MTVISSHYDLSEAIDVARNDAGGLLEETYRRMMAARSAHVFIAEVDFARARAALEWQTERRARGEALPLFGVPFAIKDNFDANELPTTAACPAFAYVANRDAAAVAKLVCAGGILVGKTNMDQFATGLVGVRSPYGICRSVVHPDYAAGGSSSGSALAVALGIVPFALGTDTAGSGRVPAAFNSIVGLKPTPGLVSTRGVVPACRSLDCASIFTRRLHDAWHVLEVIAGFDPENPFSRRAAGPLTLPAQGPVRVGVPRNPEFFGNSAYASLFATAVDRLVEIGKQVEYIDIEPLIAAGGLLYGGPWVAERYAAVGEFIEGHSEAVDPVVRDIIVGGKAATGYDVFRGLYRLAELRRQADMIWQGVDALLLPTTGTIYRVDEILAEPVQLNANLGRYTNFVNLLDMAAVAVPAGTTAAQIPFGVTFVGAAFTDGDVCRLAMEFVR
jgi:allophanate hydrolase